MELDMWHLYLLSVLLILTISLPYIAIKGMGKKALLIPIVYIIILLIAIVFEIPLILLYCPFLFATLSLADSREWKRLSAYCFLASVVCYLIVFLVIFYNFIMLIFK